MGYHEGAYIEKLSAFSALLREEGITAGIQETADACQENKKVQKGEKRWNIR